MNLFKYLVTHEEVALDGAEDCSKNGQLNDSLQLQFMRFTEGNEYTGKEGGREGGSNS